MTRADSVSGFANGEEYQVKYSLNKENMGNWIMDIEYVQKNNKNLIIEEGHISFAEPIADELTSKGNTLINHYLEEYVLSETKFFNKRKMEETLKDSFVEVKWVTEDKVDQKERMKFQVH